MSIPYSPYTQFTFVQQGWQCPICKAVLAPWMVQCFGPHVQTSGVTVVTSDASRASPETGGEKP